MSTESEPRGGTGQCPRLRPSRVLLAALMLSLPFAACNERPLTGGGAGPGGATFGAAGPGEFIDVTFEFLHPIFLRHKIGQGPKAALWAQRYYRRWVRWTGEIRSFSANGITVRQLPVTGTFDVSLWVNNAERAALRQRYKIGDVVTYVGRLDSYDDIWRTLYLVNGSVVDVVGHSDGGF